MNSVRLKICLVGFSMLLLSACAHYPSQYSTYSTTNSYYPGGGSYPQRYTQYNYYPTRPLPSYSPSYYGYSRPYGGSYQSNSYYYQNNNVYNPPRSNTTWSDGHGHHDHTHYPPSSGYSYPHRIWDNRRDDHNHHSDWRDNRHDNDKRQSQPITIRNVDKNYIHIDNHPINKGNNPHSSNWDGGRNNIQAQPRPQIMPTHHADSYGQPRVNPPNSGWGNRRDAPSPAPNRWVGGQSHNDQPAARPQVRYASQGGEHASTRDDGRQRNWEGQRGNNSRAKRDDKVSFGR